jgi:hypothetical protein
MAKNNYSYEKRQKELARRKKKEEKRQRRKDRQNADTSSEAEMTPSAPDYS